MNLPYFNILEKYIDRWFKAGWLVYAIIGLSLFAGYTLIRVLSQ